MCTFRLLSSFHTKSRNDVLSRQEIGVSKVNFTSSIMCLGGDFENRCSIKDLIKLKKKCVFDWLSAYDSQLWWLILPQLHPCFHLFAPISGSTNWVRSDPNQSVPSEVSGLSQMLLPHFFPTVCESRTTRSDKDSSSRTLQLDGFWLSQLLHCAVFSASFAVVTHLQNMKVTNELVFPQENVPLQSVME